MNLDNIQRIIERNTLLLMYEPGAGGDFVTAMLSVDPKINGSESNVEFHKNGRIKAVKQKRSLYVNNTINDYEFYSGKSYIEILKEQILTDALTDIVTSHGKFISKVHPYFNDGTNLEKLKKYINANYKNSSKIMILRNRETCMKNHQMKNNVYEEEIYYNSEWYEMYEDLKTEHPDIISINFCDMLKQPIHTMKKIYHVMGYKESEITHNFSINTDKIKYIYNTYIDNQNNLEPFERYWT